MMRAYCFNGHGENSWDGLFVAHPMSSTQASHTDRERERASHVLYMGTSYIRLTWQSISPRICDAVVLGGARASSNNNEYGSDRELGLLIYSQAYSYRYPGNDVQH